MELLQTMIKLLLITLVFSLTTDSLSKTTLAILELKDKGVSNSTASILTDNLISEFSKIIDYEIVEREQLETILKEQGLQNSGLCNNNECLVQIGGLLGAQKMVTGSIGQLGAVYSLSLRIFDIESAKTENSVTLNKKCSQEELFDLVEEAVAGLTSGATRKTNSNSQEVATTDYRQKMQELKEFENSVEAFENKRIDANIKMTAENIAATIASATAAYFSEYPTDQILTELSSIKTEFGENVSPNTFNMKIPNDFKVEVTNTNVIVIHRSGISRSIQWK